MDAESKPLSSAPLAAQEPGAVLEPPPALLEQRAVFVHIPRTGGSNLWHSAAHAFSVGPDPIPIVDLFHESLCRYDNIQSTARAAEAFRLFNLPRCLVHHHTSFGIWRSLGHDLRYFTILRDPIERAISHYFHSFQLYFELSPNGTDYTRRPEVNPELVSARWGDDAFGTLLSVSQQYHLLSNEAIVLYFRTRPGLTQNYYTQFFHRYFEVVDESDPRILPPGELNRALVRMLVERIKTHFTGIFFSVDDAFTFLEALFERPIETRDRMPNRACRGLYGNGVRLRRALAPFFKYDLYLYDRLRPKEGWWTKVRRMISN